MLAGEGVTQVYPIDITLETIRKLAQRMQSILELSAPAVGVSFLTEAPKPGTAIALTQHRFCQALMRARHGEIVSLDAEGIACPAAAAAFGFRPLPEGLRNGKGLVGFGIVQKEEVGRAMFDGMSRLPPGQVKILLIFPLPDAPSVPDVIVVEDTVERLMWINLAYLNYTGGQRVSASTAVLQATCVDAAIIPYLEQRLNFSFGCYGCRDATDLTGSETVLGFPVGCLESIVDHLEYLSQKAIPTSRSKKAHSALVSRKTSHPISSTVE
jgi:uncharacterized protein (DUF169 family)